MSETCESDNNANVENNESTDCTSIEFISEMFRSKKQLCFFPDSNCNCKNIDTKKTVAKKKSFNPDNWTRNLPKSKRTKGLAYRSRGGGNLTPAKTFVDVMCRCRHKCNQKILSHEREAAMREFYNLHSQLEQNIYLRGFIQVKEIKRRRPTNNTKEPRLHSFTYYFRKDKIDIPVCKKYFRDTYQVSDGRLYKCCSKDTVEALADQRKCRVASNKIDDTHVVKQIKSFLARPSPYPKACNLKTQYLNLGINIKKMYELYVAQCKEENIVPVKIKFYYKVFSKTFKLYFKHLS